MVGHGSWMLQPFVQSISYSGVALLPLSLPDPVKHCCFFICDAVEDYAPPESHPLFLTSENRNNVTIGISPSTKYVRGLNQGKAIEGYLLIQPLERILYDRLNEINNASSHDQMPHVWPASNGRDRSCCRESVQMLTTCVVPRLVINVSFRDPRWNLHCCVICAIQPANVSGSACMT